MKKTKQMLTWILAIAMVLSMVPMVTINALASATYSVLMQTTLSGTPISAKGDTAFIERNDADFMSTKADLVRYTGQSVKKIAENLDRNIYTTAPAGYLVVKNAEWRYGIVDSSGKQIVDYLYSNIEMAPDGLSAIAHDGSTGDNGTYYVLNLTNNSRNGFPLEGNSGSMFTFPVGIGGGYVNVISSDDSIAFRVATGNEAGQNKFGKTYRRATSFSEGYAVVKTVGEDVYQIIDTSGKTVASAGSYSDYGCVSDGLIRFTAANNSVGYMNLSGEVVIPAQYAQGEEFHNGYAVVLDSSRRTGLIDRQGDPVIPCGTYRQLTNASDTGLVWAADQNNIISVLKLGPASPFIDVKASDWFYNEVNWAVQQNITAGTSNNTFSPNKDCTHAEILTFLWRAAGKPKSSARLPFTPKNAWAADALAWAYEKGMLADAFDETARCTSADAMNYIWQAKDKPAATYDGRFTDVPKDAGYAEAVAWAVQAGVTVGTSSTTFAPDTVCSRGRIVVFLFRAFGA